MDPKNDHQVASAVSHMPSPPERVAAFDAATDVQRARILASAKAFTLADALATYAPDLELPAEVATLLTEFIAARGRTIKAVA